MLVVAPLAMETGVGAMLMPVSVAAVTVMLAAGEVTPLNAAVRVVAPAATPVALPLLTEATAVSAVAQVTMLVTSTTCPLENVPTAVKLAVVPLAIVAVVGVMAMLDRVTGVAGAELVLLPPPHADSKIEARNSTP